MALWAWIVKKIMGEVKVPVQSLVDALNATDGDKDGYITVGEVVNMAKMHEDLHEALGGKRAEKVDFMVEAEQ